MDTVVDSGADFNVHADVALIVLSSDEKTRNTFRALQSSVVANVWERISGFDITKPWQPWLKWHRYPINTVTQAPVKHVSTESFS